jgi:hypothetical protein
MVILKDVLGPSAQPTKCFNDNQPIQPPVPHRLPLLP